MAQTTGAFAGSNFKAEVSLNGSSWTDISGQATQVTPGGGDHMIGEQHTADGDAPVVTGSNKTEAAEIEVNILYTETASEAFDIVGDAYRSTSKQIYFRYAPKGGATANKRWFTANSAGTATPAQIVNCLPPEVDAGSGDPAMASFTLRCPKLVEEAIP
jgi:hypothetical protein